MAGDLKRLPVRVLLGSGAHDYRSATRPLMKFLESSRHFDLSPLEELRDLDPESVLIAASDEPIGTERAAALTDFVRKGGGLVLLHGTLAAWSPEGELAELAGWAPGARSQLSELVVKTDPTHPISARIGSDLKFDDELFLTEGPPADARVFLHASWRYTDQVVGYERKFGDGTFIYLGLGHSPASFETISMQKMVARSLLVAGGRAAQPTFGVGLVGYGAIARAHAASIAMTPGLRLSGVCDVSATRREMAKQEWDVRTHDRAAALYDDPDVDLVIVGTPPNIHVDSVLEALGAGKHVVCEKPFALRVEDVDRMMDAATRGGKALTVYQSRRWDPDFVALRDTVRAGTIGDPFYMESFIGGFSHPCDYWHSHEPISGGTIFDWGSHYFDWLLQLFRGDVTSVSAQAHKRVWHDVTNSDQVRVDLTFEGGAQATFLQSDIAAALKPKWYLLGTKGAIVGDWEPAMVQSRTATGEIVHEPAAPADSPARLTVSLPADGGPSHEQVLSLPRRDPDGFYRNLADHLIWAEPLAVSPAEARRNVAVMETATRSITEGGRALEVRI